MSRRKMAGGKFCSRRRRERRARDLWEAVGIRGSRCCGAVCVHGVKREPERERRRQTLIGAALPSGYGLSSFPNHSVISWQEASHIFNTEHIINVKWCYDVRQTADVRHGGVIHIKTCKLFLVKLVRRAPVLNTSDPFLYIRVNKKLRMQCNMTVGSGVSVSSLIGVMAK